MTDNERAKWEKKIDRMGHVQMARLQRFAPAGHPIFDERNGLNDCLYNRLQKLGGITPAISKAIGW